ISVVGRGGRVLLDCLVHPEEEVTDWRTTFTGLDEASFAGQNSGAGDGLPVDEEDPRFRLPRLVLSSAEAIQRANALLDSAVVVGHDLRHDLKLLGRHHQRRCLLRDTAFFPMLAAGVIDRKGGLVSLRALASSWLDDDELQSGSHSSVEDARAAMLLYRLVAKQWEVYARRKWGDVPVE
ncbi:unnamed protein product, partial [Polarella glacialis]